MKKIISFIKGAFFAFGFASYMLVLLDVLTPYHLIEANLFRAIALNVTVICLLGVFIFKKGLSKKSLWIRRIIIIGISCIVTPGVCIMFGCINGNAFGGYWSFIAKTTSSIIILSIITYFIADKIEKNNLKKINAKLQENNSDQ